jgi:catechol 2,3-dioxygenase-like lactoylglutathione lyase family enzyme
VRLSHVTIGVPSLDAGIDTYTRLGFSLTRDGNRAIAPTEGEYLALEESRRDGILDIVLDASPKHRPAAGHPNGAIRLERVYVAVENLAASVENYRKTLDLPAPKLERGTVIMADMAIFNVGPGLTLAQPYAPGHCADALASRGPGPFQLLYRITSMDAAAKWLSEHGVPPPARGVRNTGEQAMLIPAERAFGTYVGFVGMA